MEENQNKTLFTLQQEEKKNIWAERRNLIIGALIFVSLLPVDYIVINKVIEYREKSKQPSQPVKIILHQKSESENNTQTTADPSSPIVSRPNQPNQINKSSDGWLEVDGKRYFIKGQTITRTN